MTYCLAMRLDEGLVFMSDTRTNAGVDNIGTYRKLHVLSAGPDRVFILQSAGITPTPQMPHSCAKPCCNNRSMYMA